MTKHRKTRKRNQKGGAWYNPFSWGQQDPNIPRRSWGEWFSGTSNNIIQSADNAVGTAANTITTGAQNAYSSVFSSNSTPQQNVNTQQNVKTQQNVPLSDTQSLSSSSNDSTISTSSNSTIGGRKRTRRMKGGYSKMGGPENLAYYADPVNGLKVAAPTYWVASKGGSKRRSQKERKTKRHRK
jgi:hypothetical protein